jgi:glycosyltransferase involved in cell wall biosynthesis
VRVALAHDYLTQRGGAERVVLSMLAAFPEAELHTLLYDPAGTFPEFSAARIRACPLNRVSPFRRNHRLAFPVLAPFTSRLRIDADVVVCSSSGWAHGFRTTGAKVVYCHSPARWLYQPDAYLRGAGAAVRLAARSLRSPLKRWDRRAARTAARYVVNSSHVARSVHEQYGIDAEVLPPPPALTPEGGQTRVEGIEPGYVLCVSRLLPYKNVDAVVRAFERLPDERLVVVGDGPLREQLRGLAGPNVTLLGKVADGSLRWLYEHASALVVASLEDYGLTPLEAASFDTPTAALRFGGLVDTVADGETGLFFGDPRPGEIATVLRAVLGESWDPAALEAHAAQFSRERFVQRLREIVEETAG